MTAKYITKGTKYIINIHTLATKAAKATSAIHTICTKLIITCTFIWVTQAIVSLGCLLKFLFSLFIAWITIRMIFNCNLFICSFNFFSGCSAFYAKYFIIIFFVSHDYLSLSLKYEILYLLSITVLPQPWHDELPYHLAYSPIERNQSHDFSVLLVVQGSELQPHESLYRKFFR